MDVSDITLIGSGIASTLTLIEVFNSLLKDAPGQKKSITVIEKTNEFWKGIPYGSRSSVNALTITSVFDFINEQESPLFFKWLKDSRDKWIPFYREQGSITAERWLNNNLPLIEKEAWEDIYMPRFLYGNYLAEKLTGLLKTIEESELAVVTLIQAEAIAIKTKIGGLYEITLEHPNHAITVLASCKVVIATGSAPVKKLYASATDAAAYINDIYEPSVTENLRNVQQALLKANNEVDRNILVIGSNASSIELLYLVEGLPELRTLIHKIVIISTSGILPYHISTEALETHPIPNLDKVSSGGSYDIKTLTDAAALDIQLAVANGANMNYVATVISNTLKLMEPLGEQAKKEFYCIYGLRLRDMFRRSGPEYKSGSQQLVENEEAVMLKGRFVNVTPVASGALLNYLDTSTGMQETYPMNFKVIINCTGSDNVDQCSSRLVYNLVHSGLCRMNLSGKGFEVNEKFEAAPNLFVMGPLLGGNVNKLIHFWQLENASRLTYLAPYLAKELLTT